MDRYSDQEILKGFGKNLKKIREDKHMSLRQLADIAEMNFGNIGDIELGKVNPGVTTIVRLAHYLGVHPGDFFD